MRRRGRRWPELLGLVLLLALSACTSAVRTSRAPGGRTPVRPTTVREPAPPLVPRPFGRLSCHRAYTVRFCPGNGRSERVPSFDGVPLDADVTLPPRGRGPFPLMVLLHGLGASKVEFESHSYDGRLNNVTLAREGWAVLNYSARGFGNSCGTPASRAHTPGCAKGWLHLADQRYEVRDTQYLAGLLVDEGLVLPRIAVAGESYGGGQALELAVLKNRVRLTDGRFVPWVSPRRHVPMSVGAAYAIWGWDDLASSLMPNGHLLAGSYSPPRSDLYPIGVEKQSWVNLLYEVTTLFDLAPAGRLRSADLTTWHSIIAAGEPYPRSAEAALRQLQQYHSPIGIPFDRGGPAPVVMENGWTDTLFPVSEALHYAERYKAARVSSPLLQIFDDVGHGWAANRPAEIAWQTRVAMRFIDDVMFHRARPETGVLARGTTCPASAPSGPLLSGRSLAALYSRRLDVSFPGQHLVTSNSGAGSLSARLNPAYSSAYCDPLATIVSRGESLLDLARAGPGGLTLVGPLRIEGRLAVKGSYPELVGRLWDCDPATGRRQLVEAGVYRPWPRGGRVHFDLSANLYRLAPGHLLQLELLGSSPPWFRPSNGTFRLVLSHLSASIGVHG